MVVPITGHRGGSEKGVGSGLVRKVDPQMGCGVGEEEEGRGATGRVEPHSGKDGLLPASVQKTAGPGARGQGARSGFSFRRAASETSTAHTMPSQSLSFPSLALPVTPALPASKVFRCLGRDCKGLPTRIKPANPHHEILPPLESPRSFWAPEEEVAESSEREQPRGSPHGVYGVSAGPRPLPLAAPSW